jgi:poly(3-hydroxyalkanoate) synthetase
MSWRPGSPVSNPRLTPDDAALEAEAAFLHGIKAWRGHPWRRTVEEPPAIWTEGPARLLDFGGSGPAFLFVPSLVNRWTILDLMPRHSMVRHFSGLGMRTLVLDWGEPEPAFTLTDHIAGRLVRAIQAAGGGVFLAGYCMGGTFAAAAAALRPDLLRGLALLAAPWDFHAGGIERLHKQAAARAMIEAVLHHHDTVPVDVLQTLFALDDPGGVAEKFRRFGQMDPASESARLFVAIEDWLNDGLPLSGTTAREILRDWYGDNLPARGLWRVAGLTIDPGGIAVPAFAAIPKRDRIVPPPSALALVERLPDVTLLEPDAGHVGMTAGKNAPDLLWNPLRDWALAHGGTGSRRRRRG